MKVYEIISEQGLLGKFFTSASKPILGSAKEFSEIFGTRIAQIAQSRGISLEQAAELAFKKPTAAEEAVVQRYVSSGYSREAALRRIGLDDAAQYERHPYFSDPKIRQRAIDDAKDKVKGNGMFQGVKDFFSGAKDTGGKVVSGAKTVNNAINMTFNGVDWLVSITVAVAGLAPPYAKFRMNMIAAGKDLDSGDLSPEEFNSYADRQVGLLITQWAAVLAAGGLAKLLTLKPIWRAMAKSNIAGIAPIGSALSIGVSSSAAFFVQNKVNEASDSFAKLLLSPFLSWLPDNVGSLVRGAINTFAFGIGLGRAGDEVKQGTPKVDDKTATNTSADASNTNTAPGNGQQTQATQPSPAQDFNQPEPWEAGYRGSK